jgi:P-type Cu+ transporter
VGIYVLIIIAYMAKDPICGMFVEKNENSIHYAKNGITYYFYASQCLNEFVEPEKELKKLKIPVAISIALSIPIIIFSLPHMIPQLGGHLFSMELMGYTNYIIMALATPIQFWIEFRFYRGFWDGIKARASNMDTLIAIGTSAAYLYSAIVTLVPDYFPFTSVYFEIAAIIITLILTGRLLETKTKDNASNAVRKLLNLKPRTARVIRPLIKEINDNNEAKLNTNNKSSQKSGISSSNINLNRSDSYLLPKEFKETEIPIEQIIEGDLMVIRQNERISTDGIIIEGNSSVD